MESWLPTIFGFGGVLVGSFFSLWLTKLQLKNADKRLEREFRKAEEDAQHQRRWEVRSVPLIKLRDDLAISAARLHTLVTNTQLPRNWSVITEVEQQQALEGLREYMVSGGFRATLNLQYDTELIKLVEQIESSYMLLFEYALDNKNIKSDEKRAFREISESTKTK